MIKYLSKIRVILVLLLIGLLVILLISACNAIGIGGVQEAPRGPSSFRILAPRLADGETIVKALVNSPVQIQSSHPADDISRVELWVQEPGQETDKLLRSDVPSNGIVLQEWIPQQTGTHTIKVRTFDTNNQRLSEQTQPIEIIYSSAVSVAAVVEVVEQPPVEIGPEFEPPTATPLPEAVAVTPELEVAVVKAEVQPTPSPTPVPHYPPPPPAPGVSPGPVQANLPSYGPPVCNAAEYLDVFVPDTSRRVSIEEPDDVPARVVGGVTVYRAWKMQNIGTCTWGPGYELAFYGGRAMGSGGVAFESPFPSEPGRRNIIVDNNRLIVPEGKPNQVAVAEVLLNVPVTPGIHQSYWRMRNPHGIYFGPIVGVTFEVVRPTTTITQPTHCEFGIYGAPTVNKFEIVGVGNVFQPEDPVSVLAKFGTPVTLEWNIINATSFNIVFEDPTGDIQSISTPNQNDRATFTPKTVGRHVITLYADNGPCVAAATVYVDVVPPDDEQFRLDLILSGTASMTSADENIRFSSAVATNTVRVQWNHFDQETNRFILIAEAFKRDYSEYCPVVDSVFGWKGHCYMTWGDWGSYDKVVLEVGGEGDAQGAATIANIERKLCPGAYDPEKEDYGIRYTMRAEKDGRAAKPALSNTVDVRCDPYSTAPPIELKGAGTQFNPVD